MLSCAQCFRTSRFRQRRFLAGEGSREVVARRTSGSLEWSAVWRETCSGLGMTSCNTDGAHLPLPPFDNLQVAVGELFVPRTGET